MSSKINNPETEQNKQEMGVRQRFGRLFRRETQNTGQSSEPTEQNQEETQNNLDLEAQRVTDQFIETIDQQLSPHFDGASFFPHIREMKKVMTQNNLRPGTPLEDWEEQLIQDSLGPFQNFHSRADTVRLNLRTNEGSITVRTTHDQIHLDFHSYNQREQQDSKVILFGFEQSKLYQAQTDQGYVERTHDGKFMASNGRGFHHNGPATTELVSALEASLKDFSDTAGRIASTQGVTISRG